MARIPDAEIERLKSEVSLVRLVEASGVELKRHGKDFHGRCPFHDDRTPSLVVSPDKNLWHCLGACGTGGSVIDWVMKIRGVSFRHAVELLREDVSLAAGDGKTVKQSTVRSLPPPVSLDVDDAALLGQVVGFYHETLKQSPEALEYLRARGLTNSELIDTFKLGYANRTLGLRLPAMNRKEGAQLRTRLQQLGVIRESGHEHFNGSIVMPLLNEHGQVVQMYGRKVRNDLRPGTPLHLYLPGPHRGIWNAPALAASEEVILCEALIDAATFWCAGHRNVTTSYGVNGFTEEHLAAFQQAGVKRVLIAYDRDDAGDAAAQALGKKLTAAGLDAFRILFPHGLDANAYALKVQPASQSLAVAIRGAEWMGSGTAPKRNGHAVHAEHFSLAAPAAKEEKPVSEERTADPPLPEPPAQRVPATVAPMPVEVSEHELQLVRGERMYRVRGLDKNLSYERLSIWLRATHGEHFHVDTLELYSAKQRQAWLKQASVELGCAEEVLRSDLSALLQACEQRQEELIRAKLAPHEHAPAPALSGPEREAGLALLRDPELMTHVARDIEAVGLVGERSNALVSYLACVSRLLEKPLAILIQSTSAAGKSTLMDAVLSLMPEDQRVHYSAMTGQSLFYLGEQSVQHRILAIAEEEGVRQAAYALKVLQSQGELTIASTGKDATTGQLITQEYRVEGPVMLFLTTTAIDVDEELQNRCLVLTIDESREQTQAIQDQQRKSRTLAGVLAGKQAERIRGVHRAAQQLLEPVAVINPFAERLTFRADGTRLRRDHQKYLTLIEAIAFLHQHQRAKHTQGVEGEMLTYVEVTKADIHLANQLAHDVLGRCLDELPPQTRRLLCVVCDLVDAQMKQHGVERGAVRFSRRDVRQAAGVSDTQARMHLQRLVDLEYLIPHAGARGQNFVYELAFDGDPKADVPHMMGLLDVESL